MPCGTPESTVVALDEVPSTKTCMVHSARIWRVLVTLYLVNLWRRRSRGTVSKAFEKSSIAISTVSLCQTTSGDRW